MTKIIDIRVNEPQALFLSASFQLSSFVLLNDKEGATMSLALLRRMIKDKTVTKEDIQTLNSIVTRLANDY